MFVQKIAALATSTGFTHRARWSVGYRFRFGSQSVFVLISGTMARKRRWATHLTLRSLLLYRGARRANRNSLAGTHNGCKWSPLNIAPSALNVWIRLWRSLLRRTQRLFYYFVFKSRTKVAYIYINLI